MERNILPFVFLLLNMPSLLSQIGLSFLKNEAIQFIDHNKEHWTRLSDSIWHYAEPSFKEYKSSRLIIETLRKEGFRISGSIEAFPTVFMAEYGEGKPIIGLYGEYDADFNASNKTVPRREELVKEGMGHGGAHNLLGVGSLATALAIKALMDTKKLSCTIRYYGSTAEGTLGTRAWLARGGFFKDLDLSLYWHPAPVTAASTRTWDALIDFNVLITSKKVDVLRKDANAHHCQSAAERILSTIIQTKQAAASSNKVNYSIASWKNELGSPPDTVLLDVRIQCSRQSSALEIFSKIKKELNTLSDSNVTCALELKRAHHQFLPNVTAMKQVFVNMQSLGPIMYSKEDLAYTQQLQAFLKKQNDTIVDQLIPFQDVSADTTLYGHSSDIGEASWFAPEIYFVVKCLPLGMKMHHWQGTAFTAHAIGHKGMLQAAKIMAMTIIDYVQKPDLQKKIHEEFKQTTRHYTYQSLVDDTIKK
ncbi:MAG: hypothetical protein SFV55_07050 [Haliscomenobacter sp.]|uniref:hypothetical protein n=1 Tax=Haliscomenobacter sp. TaxID=2717303 RepID=UPI0029ABCAB4|nr:hypothetical protein [Haliscomenobacter sp.]MDX2068167.1 hypothetical protein [Haliscomenobacter sp.]